MKTSYTKEELNRIREILDLHMVIVELPDGSKLETLDSPVTQELWELVMGTNPSSNTQDDPNVPYSCAKNRPVDGMTWAEGNEFCNKLSKIQGLKEMVTITDTYVEIHCDAYGDENDTGYRLPTIEEWRYFLEDDTKYPNSNNKDDVAWDEDNKPNSSLQEVGLKKPSKHGLYDLVGEGWTLIQPTKE